MNFKIVLNIQWLFFILLYGCCNGDVGGAGGGIDSSGNDYYNKEVPAEVTRNVRIGAKINRTREFNERSGVLSQLDRKLAGWTGGNQSERVEEHDRFEVSRKQNDSKSSLIGYGEREEWNVDDYEYKIANQRGGRRQGEIDDKEVNGRDDRDLAEKKKSKRLARKLLSIETDPVAVDDRDDTVAVVEASDYGVDKERLLTATSEFNGDDDDLEEHKQRRNRRWGSRPNGANQDRRRKQEMDQQRRVDSRKSGQERETIPEDKSTVYRQRYPPVADDEKGGDGEAEEDPGAPEVVESTTVSDACDCVAKCASERVLQEAETSTEESSSDTGDNDEMTTEEIEQEEEEEGEEEEEEEVVDEKEEPEEEEPAEEEEEEAEEKKELTTEGTTLEAESGASKQREVYIDLKIGIKSVGNGSLSEDSEPLEFHKKILVKREKIGDELRYQLKSFQQQQPSSSTHFPISLVKAIYQLVDRNDSLRTHVAPHLPARSKVLSKLSKQDTSAGQRRARQKINDQRGPQHQRALESGRPISKKNSKGVDKVVAVIDALKELIQQ